jgi:hypothetical protein
MAMVPGTITIDPATGADSGTGAAYELFQDYDAKQDYGTASGTVLAAAKQQVADLCESVAQVIVNHVTTNGKAVVDTGDAGLQRLPAAPMLEDDPCKAPAAKKTLAIE